MKLVISIAFMAVVFLGLAAYSADHSSKMSAPGSTPMAPVSHNALFVVNGASNSLSVIDTRANQVVGTIALQNVSYPHHINISPHGSKLLIAIPGIDLSAGHGGGHHGGHAGMTMDKGAVMVLDAKTGSTIASSRLKEMNHNAIFSPDSREIWTGQMSAPGTVLVLDATTLAPVSTIAVGDEPAEVTFSRDGKYAFVANGRSNTVSVIDTATKAVVKTIPVGQEPVGAWTGSNGVMYVDNESGKSLTAIDATSLAVLRTYNLGFTPAMAVTALNGELWVTDTENGKVVFYKQDSDSKLGEAKTGAGAHAIVFSSDGKTAYVSNQMADTVSVIDVATHAVKATMPVGKKPNGMAWRAQ